MGKSYDLRYTVTIGDTDLLQSMYFLNFFRLQGMIRELWVKDCVEGGLQDLAQGFILITKEASNNYRKDFYLYDNIVVKFQFTELHNTYAVLNFKFYEEHTMELRAEGFQKVVFANNNHKLAKILPNWRKAIEEYLIDKEPAYFKEDKGGQSLECVNGT
jgi:acyl-CoA thioesterase FadM